MYVLYRSSQMNDVATSSIYLSKEYVAEEVGRLRSHKYVITFTLYLESTFSSVVR